MDRISMIRDFTLAKGPSGFEDEVLAVARRYAPEGVEIREMWEKCGWFSCNLLTFRNMG